MSDIVYSIFPGYLLAVINYICRGPNTPASDEDHKKHVEYQVYDNADIDTCSFFRYCPVLQEDL